MKPSKATHLIDEVLATISRAAGRSSPTIRKAKPERVVKVVRRKRVVRTDVPPASVEPVAASVTAPIAPASTVSEPVTPPVTQEPVAASHPEITVSEPVSPPKRKRGRPRKNPDEPVESIPEGEPTVASDEESEPEIDLGLSPADFDDDGDGESFGTSLYRGGKDDEDDDGEFD